MEVDMKKFQAEPEREISDEPVEDVVERVENHQDDVDENGADDIFPDEYMMPLKGLLYLGDIQKEIEYGGHRFLIRTLKEGEILRIGQLLKDYVGTAVEIEARRCFTVAASVVSVDGVPLKEPITPSGDNIYDKFQEVRQWYPAVVHFLYSRYAEIESTAINVSNALKK